MGGRWKSSLLRVIFLTLTVMSLALMVIEADAAKQQNNDYADIEDNDFAEFDFEDETDESTKVENEDEDEDIFVSDSLEDEDDEAEVTVDDDGSEFSHFEDEEEFVGYNERDDSEEFVNQPTTKRPDKAAPQPKLKIANIPAHLRTNWENYYVEILMIFGIVVYFLNFFTGKTKNQKIANMWFNSHRNLLESQFSLVGDDGSKNIEEIQEPMTKESENVFTFWCSGRICCEGMLVELKLLKRQDLVGVISNVMKPAYDQVHIRVDLSPEDMDSFIFCISSKKSASRLSKEMNDLATYCPEKRAADKYDIPGTYFIMSEVAEVASAMMDAKLVSMFRKFPEAIDTIHFSDQYTGPKPADDQQPLELPQGKNVLIFVFNILAKDRPLEEAIEDTKPLMMLVFYCLDKVKRYKLSREAKNKADKNRSKVAENHWRSIHAAKAEKAAEERERKRREMKERIKEIEDPEKQRKMEERENRREKKKMAPKMKQLKVKSM